MQDFATMPLDALLNPDGYDCACGNHHETHLRYLKIGGGAVQFLPEALEACAVTRPFIVCDENTKAAAWERVRAVLDGAGVPHTLYTFKGVHIEPDEIAVGSLTIAFDPTCDGVLAIGSGVINDCAKVLAHASSRPSLVVATAPSMDGYASNSSSMIINRLKTTVYNECPLAIIADTDILKQAPQRMLWAGLGDMLAKYISICEWRISNLAIGEHFCPNIAGLVRRCVQKIVINADRLMQREPEAIEAVLEGLVLSGVAMSYAQNSRPASGLEHYFSHLWEMMALDRGTAYELHGIQVGVGTYLTLRILEQLKGFTPDREKVLAKIAAFSPAAWEKNVRRVFGKAAGEVLAIEEKAQKNSPGRHVARLDAILNNWDIIQTIIDEELPPLLALEKLMRGTGMPMTPGDLGISAQDVRDAYVCSRDIRDKYLTSSLLWDLGLLDVIEP